MNIIGINDAHNSSVCLTIDGENSKVATGSKGGGGGGDSGGGPWEGAGDGRRWQRRPVLMALALVLVWQTKVFASLVLNRVCS